MELGVSREPDDDIIRCTKNEDKSWVPLMQNLRSMEIRYFDPRLNAWVDRWTDRGTLPHLVKVTLDHVGGIGAMGSGLAAAAHATLA